MDTRRYTMTAGPDDSRQVEIHARGLAVLDDPQINRGTAFTWPSATTSACTGCSRPRSRRSRSRSPAATSSSRPCETDVEKWVFLTKLHDSNEVLFYRLVGEHVHEMLPIVYTPTVGTAIEEFSHLFRRPRGVFLNIDDIDGIDRALDATGLGPDDVDLIVASDAEAILGIGDWGVGGIDISIGKLAVYTVAAGIDPRRVLAVGLDVGTNREELLNDPRYLGLRRSRVRGEAYDAFIDAYVASASEALPERDPALGGLLRAAGPRHPRRGTATRCAPSTTTSRAPPRSASPACSPGVRVSGGRLTDQQIVVFGAGSAGVGIADLIALAMTEDGLSAAGRRRSHLAARPARACSPAT